MSIKKRFTATIILFVLTTIALVLMTLYVKKYPFMLFLFSYVIANAVMLTFLIGGFSSLIINFVYAAVVTIFIYSLPKYDMVFTIAGSFLFVLNPLRFFQKKLEVKFNEKPFAYRDLVGSGSYVFYAYKSDMKEYFHFKARCAYNKGGFYYFLRNAVSSFLFGGGMFLGFSKIVSYENFMKLKIEEAIFFLFAVIVLFAISVLVSRKSFRSGLRATYSLLPIIITALVYYSNDFKNIYLQHILTAVGVLFIITTVIIQIVRYFRRVIYISYDYTSKDNVITSANALYEPYIFENGYNLVAIYRFPIKDRPFNKLFYKLLVQANFRKFIITGYTIKDGYMTLYAAFKDKAYAKARYFMHYISKLYKSKDVSLNTIIDNDHLVYPTAFSNDENYIIKRAIVSANHLKELSYTKSLMLSFFFYFKNKDNMEDFMSSNKDLIFDYKELHNLLNIDVISKNDPFKIEMFVRLILLSASKTGGNYIKISLKYPDKKTIIL